MIKKVHWETVFTTKNEKEVSWYQTYPQTSIDYIAALQLPLSARIIDVGGGDSYLIDALLDLGYTNVTLLDISSQALLRSKNRLGHRAHLVTYLESDILDFVPTQQYDFWHDRACFHFQTTVPAIESYAAIANTAISQTGQMLLGVFSEDGPLKCSGLDVKQYNSESMRFVFEREFELEGSFIEDHTTPFDTLQNFLFCGFKRRR
jgi:SAM-dependent methyltransferase